MSSIVPHFYSPSQIEAFTGCQRKWVFGSLLKMPRPQSKSAALGDAVHKQLENYLQGRPLDYSTQAGYIACAATEHLPRPEEFEKWGKVERSWNFEWKDFIFTGRVDWTYTPPEDIPTIGDHKTTSNLFYAKTPEVLLKDPQAMLYALEGMATLKTPKVRLKWGYVQTKKPYETRPVEVIVESAHVVSRMKEIVAESVVPMSRLVSGLKLQKGVEVQPEHVISVLNDVPPTASHCDAFGGCPYRAHCKDVGPQERLMLLMSNDTAAPTGGLTLMQRLALRAPENKAAAAAATTPPAPTPQPPPAPVKAPAAAEEDPLNPPESEQADAPTEASIAAAKEASKPEKKTRAKKEKTAGSTLQEVADNIKPLAPVKKGIELYLNAMPIFDGAAVENTRTLLDEARRITNEQLGVVDYRLAEYGKGSAVLSTVVVELVKTGNYGNAFVLDTASPEGGLLQNPLLELAGRNVVRGLR